MLLYVYSLLVTGEPKPDAVLVTNIPDHRRQIHEALVHQDLLYFDDGRLTSCGDVIVEESYQEPQEDELFTFSPGSDPSVCLSDENWYDMETGQYREVNAEVAASFLTHMQTTFKLVG